MPEDAEHFAQSGVSLLSEGGPLPPAPPRMRPAAAHAAGLVIIFFRLPPVDS